MQLLMSLSDWVVALNFGKRIAEGTPAEVRAHPELKGVSRAPATMSVQLLELRGVHAAYGATRVLHGIDFACRRNRSPRSSARTAPARPPRCARSAAWCGPRARSASGERIDEQETEDIARLGIAHVPDGRGTFLHLTTEENLRLGAYTRKDKAAVAATSSACMAISRASTSGAASRPARSPAASSRCSRYRAP